MRASTHSVPSQGTRARAQPGGVDARRTWYRVRAGYNANNPLTLLLMHRATSLARTYSCKSSAFSFAAGCGRHGQGQPGTHVWRQLNREPPRRAQREGGRGRGAGAAHAAKAGRAPARAATRVQHVKHAALCVRPAGRHAVRFEQGPILSRAPRLD